MVEAEAEPAFEEGAPAAELSALAAAAASLARRQRLRGKRKTSGTAPPEPTAPGDPLVASAAPAAGPASREWLRPRAAPPRPAPPPAQRLPASGPEPASPAPATAANASPARLAAQLGAEENRRRAAACEDLPALARAVAACTSCGLCSTRTQTVFADGTGRARVMFIGEAPGEQEDLQGTPFVGRAGALLTDIITKGMGLRREEVYIANVLKCRPPGNRDPSELEKLLCTPWLDRQIELLQPAVLVPLGRHAANHVLGTELSMGALRGRAHARAGRAVVPTFHPAYLLRSPGMKKDCWQDIQRAMGILGLAPPPRPA